MSLHYLFRNTILLFLLTVISYSAAAQRKVLTGYVKDSHTDEPVPFASVYFAKTQRGRLTDSSGHFEFAFNEWPKDSIVISYVGYSNYHRFIDSNKDTINLLINLDRAVNNREVVIKSKVNKGLLLWSLIVKHKPENDRYRFSNFGYQLYNKLELDLININREKLKEIKLLKPFGFIFDNVDSLSEDKPFLPVFLTETLSDYFYQNNPRKYREVIKASRTSGVNNESVYKLLGGLYQNVDVYNNFIPVFDKQFVSPASDNGDGFYVYKVADTQFVAKRKFYHLTFTPKHAGENSFYGDCWVDAKTFAVQKMNLRIPKDANINFVSRLSLVQEYSLINDSTWFLSKDKFIVDLSPLGKSRLSFTGRKTTTYKDVLLNSQNISDSLKLNRKQEEVVLKKDASAKEEEYWKNSRHEELSKNEKAVYKMVDTLQKMPIFKKYTETINFIGSGYKNIGNYQIGPWFNWVSFDSLEGYRFRFDLGTNKGFNKNLYFSGYLAYGLSDKKFKGKLESIYIFHRDPRVRLYASYSNDLDFGQSYYDEVSTDNIFALAARKKGVPRKFMRLKEERLDLFKETNYGLSGNIILSRREYEPLIYLPPKSSFAAGKGDPLNTFETQFKIRFAYLERFLENNFFRTSLGSPYPIVEFKYTKGIAGVLKSNYDYSKISGSVSHNLKIAPYGNIYFNAYAGKTFGTLPFPLLDVHPGNELHYYNKYAFNLMNRWEYISDKYAGINIEHNVGNGLFRLIPLTRKLKFRQFWNAKVLWGSLSDANKQLNFTNGNSFKTLNGKAYMELGTGVDNILKLFRVDLIWRVLPRPLPVEKASRFGVFGSFRLSF